MANFNSTAITLGEPVRGPGIGGGRGACLNASVAVTSALALADTISFGYLPPNARVLDAVLYSTDIDTGSAAITIHVGDAGNTSRFFASSIVGQAGTSARMSATSGFNAVFTSKTLIYGTVAVAAATAAAGTVTLILYYNVEEPVR